MKYLRLTNNIVSACKFRSLGTLVKNTCELWCVRFFFKEKLEMLNVWPFHFFGKTCCQAMTAQCRTNRWLKSSCP